jgi:hypothetical protein
MKVSPTLTIRDFSNSLSHEAEAVLRGQALDQQKLHQQALRENDLDNDSPPPSATSNLLWRDFARWIFLIVMGGACYGAAMGTFGGGIGNGSVRWEQVCYSAIKVPLLQGVTFALSLPLFFVLYTLSGLRCDFVYVVRALAASQASQALVLASLAPFPLVWYAINGNYPQAILFNLSLFAVAAIAAQKRLRDYFHPLISREPRHRWLLIGWLLFSVFIAVQAAWMLRPFIGDPLQATGFFRTGSFSNAYENLANIVGSAIGR